MIRKVFTQILMVVMISVWHISFAQSDNYTATMLRLLNSNEQYKQLSGKLITGFKPFLSQINQGILVDPSLSESLIDKYSDQFVYDFVSILFTGEMKKVMTLEELTQYVDILSSPEGQAYINNMNIVSQNMPQIMTKELLPMFTDETVKEKIKNGILDLPPVKQDEKIPQQYADDFYKYVVSGIITDNYIEQIGQAAISSQNSDQATASVQMQMIEWLKQNLKVIMLNSCYGIVSQEDLNFAAQLNPLATKVSLGMTNALGKLQDPNELQSLSIVLVNKYVTWLEREGVEIKE